MVFCFTLDSIAIPWYTIGIIHQQKNMLDTTKNNRILRKELGSVYGRENVSVRARGSWVHTQVNISQPGECVCRERMYHCEVCRTADREIKEFISKIVKENDIQFSTYYSDDYSDPTPRDCHMIEIRHFPTVNKTA